jgi:DNA-binding LacI/PurR family transcriptional regulator
MRVLSAIQELNYTPNIAAQQLSSGKTYTVGVLTPYFTLPSFVQRLAGVQEVMHDSAYDLVLHSVHSPEHLDEKIHTLLRQKRVDGLIILSPPPLNEEIWHNVDDIPVVIIDGRTNHPYAHYIIDNHQGGQLAATYLIEKGYQRIGFVGDEPVNRFGFTSSLHRFEGFKVAIKAAGYEINQSWYGFGVHGKQMAYEMALNILTQPEPPDAVFAASDVQAMGVLAAASELGLQVPEDIAVMGFDNLEVAEYIRLTTVHQPLHESGRLGALELLERLSASAKNYDAIYHQLPLEVVVRATA